MSTSTSEALQMLENIEKRNDKLNEWEIDFIGWISERISHGRNLSDSQVSKLENIWEKVTKEG
jgi:hypothetical protein